MPEPEATSATPVVALERITKRFGSFVANDAVDLAVMPGEIHALLGENGAGKSTLVKILYGLLEPDEGTIRLDGRPVVLDSPAAARARGIGMVFQHFSLFEGLSALENIALGLPGAAADAALEEAVQALAGRYRMPVASRRPVWSMSAGERQRIEILRCLLQKPRLLVLDEPTSVLTPDESDALFAMLAALVAEGMSVLFISHKLDEVRRHCHAATILRRGRVVARLDPRGETAASLARQMVGEAVAPVVVRPHSPGPLTMTLEKASLASGDVHGVGLHAVSLDVAAGEIVAVAGIAGNGQGELFSLLSGEAGPPDSGRVTMLGQDAGQLSIEGRRRLGAAFVPEERLGHASLPSARLSDNLLLSRGGEAGLVRKGLIDWRRLRQLAARIVSAFDVRAAAADPEARRLSGGNLQKYVIGRELTRQPRLLVVNQPSWGIDAAAARAVRQALVDAASAGAAVLVISQDLDEIFEIADRIAVIAGGRLSEPVPASATDRHAVGLLMTQGEGARHAA